MVKTSAVTFETIGGIVVRAPVPFTLSLTPHFYFGTNLAAELMLTNTRPDYVQGILIKGETQDQIVVLPDHRQDYILPLKRRYLVKDSTKVALVNGTVQSFGVKQQSMIAGIVGIPKAILAALVPIPLQIRNTHLNNIKVINETRKIEAELRGDPE